MWDHVTLRAADLDASARFYDTVLRALGQVRLDALEDEVGGRRGRPGATGGSL